MRSFLLLFILFSNVALAQSASYEAGQFLGSLVFKLIIIFFVIRLIFKKPKKEELYEDGTPIKSFWGDRIFDWFIIFLVTVLLLFLIPEKALPIPVIAIVGMGVYRFLFSKKQTGEEQIKSNKKQSGWFINFFLLSVLVLFLLLIASVVLS